MKFFLNLQINKLPESTRFISMEIETTKQSKPQALDNCSIPTQSTSMITNVPLNPPVKIPNAIHQDKMLIKSLNIGIRRYPTP